MKICDHTSVGMMVWKDGKLLLIEKAKFPFGFAVPAGHVDGDKTFEDAARRELKEEVGLDAKELKLLIEGRKDNPCRRQDGTWHYWKIYGVEASGDVIRSLDETKKAGWYTLGEIKDLIIQTERYLKKEVSLDNWQKSPGIEPVMYEWFKELKII